MRVKPTLIFGGLSRNHDLLLKSVAEQLGYRVELLPCPDNEALAIGREYCNRGECNPVYYTVGNLVRQVKKLIESGERDIERRYIFVTAGSCGPCRFGMYEAEYRQALRSIGMGNFKIFTFQQKPENQGDGEIEMTREFFFNLIKAVMVGDILNEVGYKLRPYELEPGSTDEAIERAREIMCDALSRDTSIRNIFRHLVIARREFEKLEFDFSRVKPTVKIIGEFWAQTTEGDGNYHLFRWLESEGAEVRVEPISTWLDYLIFKGKLKMKLNSKARGWNLKNLRIFSLLIVASSALRRVYDLFRLAFKFKPDPLVNQNILARYANPYFDFKLDGGEGHMEVGKNVYAFKHRRAHMVISVKPFGCMPSTQSDGAQARVLSDIKDAIFVSIETSGDAEVNVKSRIQMKLYEAKQRAKMEVCKLLDRKNLTFDQVRRRLMSDRKLRIPFQHLPHRSACTAYNFIAKL